MVASPPVHHREARATSMPCMSHGAASMCSAGIYSRLRRGAPHRPNTAPVSLPSASCPLRAAPRPPPGRRRAGPRCLSAASRVRSPARLDDRRPPPRPGCLARRVREVSAGRSCFMRSRGLLPESTCQASQFHRPAPSCAAPIIINPTNQPTNQPTDFPFFAVPGYYLLEYRAVPIL